MNLQENDLLKKNQIWKELIRMFTCQNMKIENHTPIFWLQNFLKRSMKNESLVTFASKLDLYTIKKLGWTLWRLRGQKLTCPSD